MIPKKKLKGNSKYKDCGYITFKKLVNGNWEGFFDFRYNKVKLKSYSILKSELVISFNGFFTSLAR